MRATGRNIVELFGYEPDDISAAAVKVTNARQCPFTLLGCSKTNHDQSEIYGTCSVSTGSNKTPGSETIVCPNRLYANTYSVFQDVILETWGQQHPLVVGGDLLKLRQQAEKYNDPVVAFGQASHTEFQVDSNGKMSLDWVLQRYQVQLGKAFKAVDFVGIEVQSIDTTGNYRDNQMYYMNARRIGKSPKFPPPDSRHGLNWANVHKRLIPQIIRKGNVYSQMNGCQGFFFIVPDVVFKKFEEVIGIPAAQHRPQRSNLSILTYSLGPHVAQGSMRRLVLVRKLHYKLDDIKQAFITRTGHSSVAELERELKNIL